MRKKAEEMLMYDDFIAFFYMYIFGLKGSKLEGSTRVNTRFCRIE